MAGPKQNDPMDILEKFKKKLEPIMKAATNALNNLPSFEAKEKKIIKVNGAECSISITPIGKIILEFKTKEEGEKFYKASDNIKT
jgi:hypothetical protein